MASFELGNLNEQAEKHPMNQSVREEAALAYKALNRPARMLLDNSSLSLWQTARQFYASMSQPEAMKIALSKHGFHDPEDKRYKAHHRFLTEAFKLVRKEAA
jgi:hypothetical protein